MFNSLFYYVLLFNTICILSSNAVAYRRDKSIFYCRSAIATLIVCIIINTYTFSSKFLDKGIGLYHGLFQATPVTHVFQIFIFSICAIILLLNSFYPRKIWTEKFSNVYNILFCKFEYFNSFILNKMSEQFRILEYSLIILFTIIGGVFLVSCFDLMSVFLAIELQSYGLYLLCSIYRDSEKAVSAGLTYFLLGGLASCFILLGSGLLYSNSGNTGFDGIYIVNNISAGFVAGENFSAYYNSHYIDSALTLMSVGFLFKLTAAPFHFWSPDVYDAIPTSVTTFVAIFTKISIFILLLELVHYTTNFFTFENNQNNSFWTYTLLTSSLISIIIGSILGLTQFRVKRLYTYSTISHVGFILLALSINSIDSIQSFIFYLSQYSIANLNAFIILLAIGYSLYIYIEKDNENLNSTLLDKKNSPIQLISQMKGYFQINSFVALSLAITLFSFAGIPPLIGFFAKQMVLNSALDNGYIFMALIAILTSVISAYYYLALIGQIFFNESAYLLNPQIENMTIKAYVHNRYNNNIEKINVLHHNIILSSSLSVTISILTILILIFILNPTEWLRTANILALSIFNI